MSITINIKAALFITLLLVSAYSQCTSTSTTPQYIITGVMQIGVPNQSFAQAQYNVVFSGNGALGTAANIFYAFAIAGFQTPGNQNYYSLSVEEVYFTNTNSAMTVFMNYANAANTIQTQWTKVKLTYLLVSEQFGGITSPSYFGNSYLWAGQVQLTPPKSNQPVQNDPIYSHSNLAGMCGYVDSFPPIYGTNCPADAKILYHYYVMGFQYDSTTDSSYEIRFSVRGGAGTDNNEANLNMLIQTGVTPNGAYMTIPNFGGNLDMIKVGMVLVVIRDYATYPTQGSNPQNFKYSGIFMPLSTFNSPVPITKGTVTNINHFDITTAQFKFYGFSSINIGVSSGPVDISLDLQSLYSVQLTSSNPISSLIISGDVFSSDLTATCTPNPTQMTNVLSEQYSSIPYLNTNQQTLNRIASSNGIIPGYSNQYVFNMFGYKNGNTDTLNFYMNITYGQLTAGKTYQIIVAFDQLSASGLPNGQKFVYAVQVNGQTLFINTITTTSALDNAINNIGLNINSNTVAITVSVSFIRSTAVNQHLRMNLELLQLDVIYDATSGCCALKCPAQTGINFNSNPPSCVDCNALAGLYFDSTSNQCRCLSGYYLLSGATQNCAPCTATLCATCRPDSPYRCLTCVMGATLNTFYQNCTCNSGYVPFNNTCTTCSYKCASCSVSNQCNSCADSTHRDYLNNCNCIDGFFDAGSPNCVACPSNCKTCTSATVCTSCFPNSNRTIDSNNLCSCSNGFYQTLDANNNSICSPCSPQCTQCNGSSYTCTFCNATLNLIPGYDTAGHLTCVCASGYALNAGGTCVQSSCTNDSLCSQCQVQQGGTSICVQCSDSLNRVLQTPQYICICKPGYYQNINKVCVACADGCATCNTSTICQSCVPYATMATNQTCQCPAGSYFTTNPTRYCKSCDINCAVCSPLGTCLTCVNGFNKTIDGKCVCGTGMYTSGTQCLACQSGCQTCSDISTCTMCISPLTLQNGSCVQRCDMGYYRSGSTCLSCNSGCSFCEQANNCIVCNNGLLLFSGKCYSNCPSGTVSQTVNGTCIPCNAPCRTCTVHPSRCTSCVSNSGYLYNGQCTIQCTRGTYALNGVCQICDFSCAQCLGSSTTCTACPSGKVLFNGACFNNCPYPDSNGGCSTSCPVGYYQSSASSCAQCDSSCQSCSQSATQCTTCATNRYFYQGSCFISCPTNTYGTSTKSCQVCDSSCNQCIGSKYQCVACNIGYSFQGTQCVPLQNCTTHQFFNYAIGQCRQCDNVCQTCSAQSYCTSCFNGQVPSNGVCPTINCPTNCLTCSSTIICTSCVQGFYLQNASCVIACSYPYSPINGVCQCGSGFFYNNSCVQACPSGYTAISKDCLPCDPSCLQCSQKVTYCTSCQTGYNFNSATNICEISTTTCPYGQYYQSGYCYRSCSPNSFYQGGFCFYSCSPGYQDNGYGGCVIINSNTTNNTNTTTGCSNNLYNNSGQCVNQCPSEKYPDSNKICQPCNSNCTTCQNSTICITCQTGYNLNANGSCVLNGTCSLNQLKYNGTCVDSCPVGNIGYQGSCQRICSTGQYYYNTRCYLPCPTNLRTADACVDVCPSGTGKTLINNQYICVSSNSTTVTCSFGYYYNTTQGNCVQCTSPCESCQDGSTCFTCISGYSLLINQCVSQYADCASGYYKDINRSCLKCPSKCQSCSSSSVCIACSSGYVSTTTGDCIIPTNPSNLPQFTGITVQSSYLRGNSVIMSLVMTVMPSSLSSSQVNQFFSVLASSGVNTIVSVVQWQDPNYANRIFVMVNFDIINGSSFLFLSIKAKTMGNLYATLGYKLNQSNYKAVSVYQTLGPAPSTIQAPSSIQPIIYNRTDNLPSTN